MCAAAPGQNALWREGDREWLHVAQEARLRDDAADARPAWAGPATVGPPAHRVWRCRGRGGWGGRHGRVCGLRACPCRCGFRRSKSWEEGARCCGSARRSARPWRAWRVLGKPPAIRLVCPLAWSRSCAIERRAVTPCRLLCYHTTPCAPTLVGPSSSSCVPSCLPASLPSSLPPFLSCSPGPSSALARPHRPCCLSRRARADSHPPHIALS